MLVHLLVLAELALSGNPPFLYSESSSDQQNDAPWGLARLAHQGWQFDPEDTSSSANTYAFYESQNNVTVYMLDTGIDTTHSEFSGRAFWGPNYVTDTNMDDNGHGTHLAGIAVGSTKGVARDATIISVKILDSQREGPVQHFIDAVDWVIADQDSRGGKGIINYSAVGDISPSRASAIQKAIDAGIFVVNAAGNNNDNACNYGPGNMGPNHTGFLVAAAVNYTNEPASFTNRGTCVDVWAPGVDIQSSLPSERYGYMDGTSNAAAFVTGLVAYIWGQDPTLGLGDIEQIIRSANPNAVENVPSGTTNSLVYNYFFS